MNKNVVRVLILVCISISISSSIRIRIRISPRSLFIICVIIRYIPVTLPESPQNRDRDLRALALSRTAYSHQVV